MFSARGELVSVFDEIEILIDKLNSGEAKSEEIRLAQYFAKCLEQTDKNTQYKMVIVHDHLTGTS